MYKVFKNSFSGASVTIENTDTMANVSIGTPTKMVLDILAEDGYTDLDIHNEWNLKVNKEAAEKLVATALQMKKPIRMKPIKTNDESNKMDKTAFDLIYGI